MPAEKKEFFFAAFLLFVLTATIDFTRGYWLLLYYNVGKW